MEFIKIGCSLLIYLVLLFLARDTHILEQERRFLKTNKSYKLLFNPFLHLIFSIIGIGFGLHAVFGYMDSSQNLISASYDSILFGLFLCIGFYFINYYLRDLVAVLKINKEYSMPKSIKTLKRYNTFIYKLIFSIGSIGIFILLAYLEFIFKAPTRRHSTAIFLLMTFVLYSLMFYKHYVNPKKFLEDK